MKALVIGAAGFVGWYLIRQLAADGWDVEATCLGNERVDADIPVHTLDILNMRQIEGTFSRVMPDAVIHLAAQSSVGFSWEKPALTVDINVKGTVNVIEGVRNAGPSIRLHLVGSGEQYGAVNPGECPIPETHEMRPGNIYAATKVTQDLLGDIYSRAYGMNILRTRAFNHFGPRQIPQFVVADFCRQTARIERGFEEPVILVGNLSARRDFCDVRDIVRAYSALLKTGESGGVYNVGSGHAVSIEEILGAVLSLSTEKIEVRTDEKKFRPIDVPLIEADISKLKAETGWSPRYALLDTVKETLDYWRSEVE